jgi:hypothetical protein
LGVSHPIASLQCWNEVIIEPLIPIMRLHAIPS